MVSPPNLEILLTEEDHTMSGEISPVRITSFRWRRAAINARHRKGGGVIIGTVTTNSDKHYSSGNIRKLRNTQLQMCGKLNYNAGQTLFRGLPVGVMPNGTQCYIDTEKKSC